MNNKIIIISLNWSCYIIILMILFLSLFWCHFVCKLITTSSSRYPRHNRSIIDNLSRRFMTAAISNLRISRKKSNVVKIRSGNDRRIRQFSNFRSVLSVIKKFFMFCLAGLCRKINFQFMIDDLVWSGSYFYFSSLFCSPFRILVRLREDFIESIPIGIEWATTTTIEIYLDQVCTGVPLKYQNSTFSPSQFLF